MERNLLQLIKGKFEIIAHELVKYVTNAMGNYLKQRLNQQYVSTCYINKRLSLNCQTKQINYKVEAKIVDHVSLQHDNITAVAKIKNVAMMA